MKGFYLLLVLLCFLPFITPVVALLMGLFMSIIGFKLKKLNEYTSLLLQVSIVFMGFGMSLSQVLSSSKTGFMYTAVSIAFVLFMGLLLGRFMKINSTVALLISVGTAICGGSAIAAIAPIIKSKNSQISFALIVVFSLNALALLLFPLVGHYFNMSQESFGLWAAIGIHDTSSVVGASSIYGAKALEIATTVKMIRALWIIPLSFVLAFIYSKKSESKAKIPWFIFLFFLAILISSYLPAYSSIYSNINLLGKKMMMVVLFLIGSSISIKEMKKVGYKAFLFGIILWFLIGGSSLLLLK